MWRAIASNALTLGIVILVLLAGFLGWAQRQYAGPGPLAASICYRVEPGSTMARVSRDLLAEGAISNGAIFRVGADYAGKADLLKAGSFLIPQGASMVEIVDIVTRGGASSCGTEVILRVGVASAEVLVRELDPATQRFVELVSFAPGGEVPAEYTQVREQSDTRFRVALAEGTTVWQVVESLRAADFLTGEVSALPPEGMLAPDSYEVTAGADRADLVARMQAAQAARIAEVWAERVEGLPIETPEEALILASIIEKETAVPEERPRVAAVFVNRLRQGMRLQTDPTVIYGVTNGQGVLGRGLRQSELQRETPWNTYVITGLPPTPIANPGIESLRAAVDPEASDYVFFVARTLNPQDGHAFARTLDEHNRNVAAYREQQRAAGQRSD
jgi:UPF0755 protein